MPSANFFRDLGLFAQPKFLDSGERRKILAEMSASTSERARISGSATEEGIVDETWRKTLWTRVENSTAAMVEQRLMEIKPRLEEHFHIPLGGIEPPSFLRYEPGAFYKPHMDASPNAPAHILKRRVSAVVFLNPPSNEPAPGSYGGGSLTFYGLLDGPEWEKCGFPLNADPGLLIAFRSNTVHEVSPVTHGRRFTIVSWFTNDG